MHLAKGREGDLPAAVSTDEDVEDLEGGGGGGEMCEVLRSADGSADEGDEDLEVWAEQAMTWGTAQHSTALHHTAPHSRCRELRGPLMLLVHNVMKSVMCGQRVMCRV